MFIEKPEDFDQKIKRNEIIEFNCVKCGEKYNCKFDSRAVDRLKTMLCTKCHRKEVGRKQSLNPRKAIVFDYKELDTSDIDENSLIEYTCPECGKTRKNRLISLRKNRVCNVCISKKTVLNNFSSLNEYYEFVRSHKENYGKQKEEKIFVSSNEDLKKIKTPYPKRIEFNCCDCGKITSKCFKLNLSFPMLCRSCISKQKKFSPIKEETFVKYGGKEKYYKEVGEKRMKTCLERYGVKSLLQLEKNRLKSRQEFIKKYGVDNPSKVESIKEKIKLQWTDEKKAKQAKWFKTEEFKMKNIATCLEKYGVKNGGGSKKAIEKIQKTKLEKYGVGHIERKYNFNGETFDSSWELAFYIYCIENKLDVEHEKEVFEYYYNGQKHYYIPDFKIGDVIYEVKGDHFFKGDKMINPYDRSKDGLAEAKYKCMLEHNVVVLKSAEIEKYIKYVKEKYNLEKYKKSA